MREFNRPGNGNIWKNKHLINSPTKIFTNNLFKNYSNANVNKDFKKKRFSKSQKNIKNKHNYNNSCTIDYNNAVQCLHNELFSIRLMD